MVQQKRFLFLEKVKYKSSQELGQWKGMPTICSKLHSQSQTQTHTRLLAYHKKYEMCTRKGSNDLA